METIRNLGLVLMVWLTVWPTAGHGAEEAVGLVTRSP